MEDEKIISEETSEEDVFDGERTDINDKPGPEALEIDSEPKKEIRCFVPTKLNMNYHGERAFVIGGLCYGLACRKSDDKLLITYNADPEGLNNEHFKEIDEYYVPRRIYELFMQKLSADIIRLDSMMQNLIANKAILSKMFNFTEKLKQDGGDGMDFAEAYTEEDAQKDKQLDLLKQRSQQTSQLATMAKKKGRIKAKAAKKARKGKK